MQVTRLGFLVTCVLLMAVAPQPPASAGSGSQVTAAFRADPGQGEDAARDIALVYDRICLSAFPDEAQLQARLASLDATELDQAEVRALLHDDPGRGWRLPGTPFTVTVESPPYRTCAVRRLTRDGLPTAQPYVAVVAAYVRQHGLQQAPAQQLARRLPSGADTLLLATPLLRAGAARPVETSIYATTNYHGRLDPARFPDTAGGVGVEVRLAHQIIPPQ